MRDRKTSTKAAGNPGRKTGDESRIQLMYRDEQRWTRWAEEPASFADESPYGLTRLADELRTGPAALVPVPKPTAGQMLSHLRRQGTHQDSRANWLCLVWDEQTAMRMSGPVRDEMRVNGVIWATDDRPGLAGRLRKRAAQRSLRHADLLFTVVDSQTEAVRQWLGADSPPVVYVPFGIDESFFTPAPYPERPLLVSAGSDRDRDHALLAEVLEALSELRPEIGMVVQAETSVVMPSNVTVIPRMPQPELARLYQRSTAVMVLTKPNIHASGVTVTLEGQASGRPVIMSATAGMEDYVDDGVTGLLVEPCSVQSAVDAALWVTDHPEEAAAMGRAGRLKVETHHTSSGMIAALADHVRAQPRSPFAGSTSPR